MYEYIDADEGQLMQLVSDLRAENARLQKELVELRTELGRANAELVKSVGTRALLIEATDKQAKDEGLWFVAQTAPEAYLQQELRALHRLIEGEAT